MGKKKKETCNTNIANKNKRSRGGKKKNEDNVFNLSYNIKTLTQKTLDSSAKA